jgi:glycosyltransferase involved in cell wall biosynthesis
MSLPTVAAFTDTYLPTVNGVTYTISTWRDRWADRGGRMDVVYPDSPEYDPDTGEFPVRAFDFPFYDGFRVGLPRVPNATQDADLVHVHTPFLLGLTGRYHAWREDVPIVASYHTPTAEYADYLASGLTADAIERVALSYERFYMNRVDAVVVPSEPAREHLRDSGIETPVQVVPNGADTGFFRPVDTDGFRERHGLPEGPLVGYTGRHGFEKDLDTILDAVDGIDATIVFGGDGPARTHLERRAREVDADVRFLGFLDREDLPAFYSALSVFAFPSPVETQGLVALEAIACGTPVVGVDSGALSDTVDDGETGYHFQPGDARGFREGIDRVLAVGDLLRERCLKRREGMSVEHAVDRLAEVYRDVL